MNINKSETIIVETDNNRDSTILKKEQSSQEEYPQYQMLCEYYCGNYIRIA